MTAEERRQINDLCRQIQEEQDQVKFVRLLEQLNELLEKREFGMKSSESKSV